MAKISFGNPVAARIRPPGSPFILGNFRVTATFGQIDDDHPIRHQGVDIGNGKPGGDPILAMADGTVSLAGVLGRAKVVRIRHPQFGRIESGYAHLATIDVRLNQKVTHGQRIGTLGKTGANAFHLHLGVKRNGVEIDGGSANGSLKWYGAWGNTANGKEFGYIHVSTVGPLTPIE